VHTNPTSYLQNSARYRSLIGIIGSAGAPGRTSISLNLAAEAAQQQQTALIDADNAAPALALLLGQSDESLRNEFPLTENLTLFTELSSTNEKFQNLIDINSKIYVDLGVMPKFADAIIDRRKSAQEFAQWFEKLSAIIYVAKSEEYSMRALERFIDSRSDLPKNLKVFHILNKSGTSRRHRTIERRFQALIPNGSGLVIPYDYSAFDRAQTNCSPISGVAPRSAIRKSFVELLARIENLETQSSR
jgi:MinD-like ATPase involved in chromosome partitioning or flagellar assembly